MIGADLSPSMLAEARENCRADGIKSPELIRCDSAKLPLKTSSLDAIHAGAAMHCWPRLNESLAEIYRVLKPGGAFFATTFFTDVFSSSSVSNQRDRQGFYMFKGEEEIQALLEEAGFKGEGGVGKVRREGSRCAVVKAIKYPLAEPFNLTTIEF